jgi:hypothetical protein
MDPVADGAIEAGLKITKTAYVNFLAEKFYSSLSDLRNEGLYIGVRATVVYDGYLHFVGSRILDQYTQ